MNYYSFITALLASSLLKEVKFSKAVRLYAYF